MGLYPNDSIPRHMSRSEVYDRIRTWLLTQVDRIEADGTGFERASLDTIRTLPAEPTEAQMDELFEWVIMDRFEWSYHQQDEHGYKIAAYAHAGTGTA